MTVQFEWDDKLCVQNEEIDAQHKKMIALANSIPEVGDEDTAKRIVMGLFKYTREHFNAEEAMMKQIGYPKLAEHRDQHDELISKLTNVCTEPLSNTVVIAGFKGFVLNWVVSHIMERDQEYAAYVRENNIDV